MDTNTQTDGARKIMVASGPQDEDSERLSIPKRTMVNDEKQAGEVPTEIGTKPETSEPLNTTSRNNTLDSDSIKAKQNDGPKFMDTKPLMKKPGIKPNSLEVSSEKPTAPPTEETPKQETEPSPDLDNSGSQNDGQDQGEAATQPHKDAQSDPIDEKRAQELQDIIDSHKYFVPIDTARQRSIKLSFALTLLVFLLGLALIDLMLDSGTILLLQKVPHTHFYSTTK
jgi:hypothetical protein